MGKKAQHFWIEPDELARKGIDFCSLEAQGLWLKVMRLLHASERYGYLSRDGKPVSDEQSARRCGIDVQKWIALLAELLEFDLLKRSADGILFSPELVAQAEWRANGAKRQKDFQDKKREKKRENNGEYNGYITPDITQESQPNYNNNSFSSSKEKEKVKSGGGSPTRACEKPPPSAADSENSSKRQWIELDPAEKIMSKAEFVAHLQRLYPSKNVREIGKKLKSFCDAHGKAFALERLKGWVAGESEGLSEEEFLAAFGEEEKKPSLVELCTDCDQRGLKPVTIEGVHRYTKCRHENLKGKYEKSSYG